MRLRATCVVEYDAKPEYYGGSDDAKNAAAIDEANWREDPIAFFSSFEDDQYVVTVEPVDAS